MSPKFGEPGFYESLSDSELENRKQRTLPSDPDHQAVVKEQMRRAEEKEKKNNQVQNHLIEGVEKLHRPHWTVWLIIAITFLTLVAALVPLFCRVPLSLPTRKSQISTASQPSRSK